VVSTGDIGALDEAGRLSIRGRKKEMIVTADGLNVFPEDVEGVLNRTPGVRDSAVIGATQDGRERVHAVLVLAMAQIPSRSCEPPTPNSKITSGSGRIPFGRRPSCLGTEGTRKLKRRELRSWVMGSAGPLKVSSSEDVESVVAQYTPGRTVTPESTMEELGLSSLERVELLMALERRFGVTVDEGAYAACRSVATSSVWFCIPHSRGRLLGPRPRRSW
jgi:long-chain acyl-CoA synthetase